MVNYFYLEYSAFELENVKSTGTLAKAAYFEFSFEIKVSFSTFTKEN